MRDAGIEYFGLADPDLAADPDAWGATDMAAQRGARDAMSYRLTETATGWSGGSDFQRVRARHGDRGGRRRDDRQRGPSRGRAAPSIRRGPAAGAADRRDDPQPHLAHSHCGRAGCRAHHRVAHGLSSRRLCGGDGSRRVAVAAAQLRLRQLDFRRRRIRSTRRGWPRRTP